MGGKPINILNNKNMKNVVEQLMKNKENFRLTNLDNGNDVWVTFVDFRPFTNKWFFEVTKSGSNPKFLKNPKNEIFDFMDNNTNLELDVF